MVSGRFHRPCTRRPPLPASTGHLEGGRAPTGWAATTSTAETKRVSWMAALGAGPGMLGKYETFAKHFLFVPPRGFCGSEKPRGRPDGPSRSAGPGGWEPSHVHGHMWAGHDPPPIPPLPRTGPGGQDRQPIGAPATEVRMATSQSHTVLSRHGAFWKVWACLTLRMARAPLGDVFQLVHSLVREWTGEL